jgi:hypothetical protein
MARIQFQNSYNIAYGLIGKTIWKLGRFTVGGYKGGVGSSPALFTVASDTSKLWLCVDFQSGMSGYGAVSFGFAWYFAPNVSVIYAYDYYLDHTALKPTMCVQLDINFK